MKRNNRAKRREAKRAEDARRLWAEYDRGFAAGARDLETVRRSCEHNVRRIANELGTAVVSCPPDGAVDATGQVRPFVVSVMPEAEPGKVAWLGVPPIQSVARPVSHALKLSNGATLWWRSWEER